MSFDKFLTKVFGSSNQRFLKSIQPMVEQINSLEPAVQKLSDTELRERTAAFKEQVKREVGDATENASAANAELSMRSCRKHSPSSEKPAYERRACATSTCS
jgi:preprotein translocase subunit SecA